MKRKTTTTVRVNTKTTARTSARGTDPGLTANEEKVLRMRKGIAADDMPLEAKTTNPELLQKLLDIEAKLFLDAGAVPTMSKKQHIIDRLKKKR